MDLLWHIKLGEMLGDLTVAIFLMLLAASFAVVSLMVLLPLIDLAFEKRPVIWPSLRMSLGGQGDVGSC